MNPLKALQDRLFDRVNPLVGFSVSRYVFSIGVFAAVVVFGLVATTHLGVDLLPTANTPVVTVSTPYPGATPDVVDQQVTQVVESSVSSLSGLNTIASTSSSGSSRVTLTFDGGVDQNAAANQVAALVGALTRRLPTGVTPPSVRTFDANSQPILEFGVSGGTHSLTDVQDYVTNVLVPSLERLGGVANVTVSGGPSRQFNVNLDPAKLAYYNLNAQQVTTAITAAAINQPIGTITRGADTLTFSTENVPENSDQIAQIMVDPTHGVRVSDLAQVEDSSSATGYVRVNGLPVVLVAIQQTQNSNAVGVAAAVRAQLKRTQLPAGYSVTVSNDATAPISSAVNSTYRELFITALVVSLIVLLFLGRVGTALTVIAAIPIALAGAPILYGLMGFTFNQVSLLALIVAIGIVVDDSIVVAENVERYREMGFDRREAVLKGASEVFGAVAAASLSVLSVLVPVSFIGGFVGVYLQQFALGLSAAVLVSWFEALLFLTVRMTYVPDGRRLEWSDLGRNLARIGDAVRWGLTWWRSTFGLILGVALGVVLWRVFGVWGVAFLVLYPLALGVLNYVYLALYTLLEAITGSLHALTERLVSSLRDAYASVLPAVLRSSALVLGGAAVFFVATLAFLAPRLPFNFVPQADSGSLSVNLRTPSGMGINTVNTLIARLEGYFANRKEVKTIQTEVNARASLTLQLAPAAQRPSVFALIPQYQAVTRTMFSDQPGVSASISAGGGFGGQGSSLNVNLAAPSFSILQDRTNRALDLLRTNPDVLSATTALTQSSLQNDFVPDPNRLSGTGLTASTVATLLQTYTSGTQAGNVQVNGLSYPIQVQLDPTALSDAQTLLSLPVYSSALQTNLSVGQLGSIVQQQAPLSISRTNRQYTAQLSINLAPSAPAQLVFQQNFIQDLTRAGILDNQVTLAPSSVYSQTAQAGQLASLLPQVFALALFLAYLVMGSQFNSFRYPLYLLLPVPLAIAGALWFMFFKGGSLDIFSLMAFLLLIGLSAKNAILYLDFVMERIGTMRLEDALIESARLRFRPIVMTTLTVLVISFPLIFGSGEGAEYGQGLGVIMLGGILCSAILTFFVVPAAFYLFERRTPRAAVIALPDATASLAHD
jgi:HAE1 family hydrophobic/amphiphilic exporter-1